MSYSLVLIPLAGGVFVLLLAMAFSIVVEAISDWRHR